LRITKQGSRRAAEVRRAAEGGDPNWSGVSRRASGAAGDALREPEVIRRPPPLAALRGLQTTGHLTAKPPYKTPQVPTVCSHRRIDRFVPTDRMKRTLLLYGSSSFQIDSTEIECFFRSPEKVSGREYRRLVTLMAIGIECDAPKIVPRKIAESAKVQGRLADVFIVLVRGFV
jgi:hypothetical protein